jgi:hypothetical protein
MCDRFPEHTWQIQSKVASSSKATSHQRTNILKQTEMIAAVGFWIDDPF